MNDEVALAVRHCGLDVVAVVDFCLAHSDSVPEGQSDLEQMEEKQVEAELIFKSLTQTGLKDLLFQERKAQRRSSTSRAALKSNPPPADCFDQYVQRSMQHWPGVSFNVVDPGMLAGTTTNACFWLSLVAAWSRLPPVDYDDAQLSALQHRVRALSNWQFRDFGVDRRQGGQDVRGTSKHLISRTLFIFY